MTDGLTPEEYLAQLQADSNHHPTDGRVRQGQTLRSVLSPMEVEGLLAFTHRTRGPEASMELNYQLDLVYEPGMKYAVDATEWARLYPQDGGVTVPEKKKKPLALKLALGAVAVMGLLGFAGAISNGEDNERSTDLAAATGEQKMRGQEAVSTLQRFTLPESWRPTTPPELSMSGDSESSYAFYNVAWSVGEDYTLEDFQSWFKEQEAISGNEEEAFCKENVALTEATCDVDLRSYDASGYVDYEKPHQRVTFTYTSPGEGEPRTVMGEVYSSD